MHSADGREGMLKPVAVRYRGKVSRLHRDEHEPLGERVCHLLQQARHVRAVIKEGKAVIKWTRVFAASVVCLQLHALAYNLGNFVRMRGRKRSRIGPCRA